jgi:hypothetical protein
MSKNEIAMIVAITLAVWLAVFFSSGCAPVVRPMPPTDVVIVVPEVFVPKQSWDQANLKAHDTGCPTSIYDAPGGVLKLCPVQ